MSFNYVLYLKRSTQISYFIIPCDTYSNVKVVQIIIIYLSKTMVIFWRAKRLSNQWCKCQMSIVASHLPAVMDEYSITSRQNWYSGRISITSLMQNMYIPVSKSRLKQFVPPTGNLIDTNSLSAKKIWSYQCIPFLFLHI